MNETRGLRMDFVKYFESSLKVFIYACLHFLQPPITMECNLSCYHCLRCNVTYISCYTLCNITFDVLTFINCLYKTSCFIDDIYSYIHNYKNCQIYMHMVALNIFPYSHIIVNNSYSLLSFCNISRGKEIKFNSL